MQNSELFNAKIIFKKQVNPQTVILRVKLNNEQQLQFKSGQYAELGLIDLRTSENGEQKLVKRLYSIASPSTVTDYLEFYIIAVENGLLSPRLIALNEGDDIYLGKINGKFATDFETTVPNKNIIGVATGTGIAPFLSLFKTFKDNPIWKSFTLIHGVRFARDLGYRDELKAFTSQYKNFFYIPTVSREGEEQGWYGSKGRVNVVFDNADYERITGNSINPDDTQLLMCGGPDMIKDFTERFKVLGFEKGTGNIHYERYW